MMDHIEQTHIHTTRTARLAFLGTPGPEITDIWVLLHGYRQLAPYFLAKFQACQAPHRLLVAPEGLSRFYLPGHQRVGASWMTKEERLLEIEDQRVYLDRVLAWARANTPASARLHTLGFSQGAATLWRWVRDTGLRPASMTSWTGMLPDEYPAEFVERLKTIPFWAFYATNDEFFTLAQSEAFLDQVKTRIPHLKTRKFEGKHDIDKELILEHFQEVEAM